MHVRACVRQVERSIKLSTTLLHPVLWRLIDDEYNYSNKVNDINTLWCWSVSKHWKNSCV